MFRKALGWRGVAAAVHYLKEVNCWDNPKFTSQLQLGFISYHDRAAAVNMFPKFSILLILESINWSSNKKNNTFLNNNANQCITEMTGTSFVCACALA